jgi:hypothetical protein
VKRRGRLRNRLASPAGEALAYRLDHLPLARNDLERLRDILAELRKLRRTAAGAALRRCDHDPLARQMLRERLSPRAVAFEGFDGGRGLDAFRRKFVLARIRLHVLQLHLQLVEEPFLAFRAHAIERATQLLELQPQLHDQRIGARCGRLGVGQIGLRLHRARLARKPRRSFGEDQRMCGDKIGGKRINRVRHLRRES